MSEIEQKLIDTLRRKRGNIKGTLTRLEMYGGNINQQTTAEDIIIRLELLEKSYGEFKDVEDRLTAYAEQPSELADFEERYITLKARLRTESNKRNNMFNDLHQQFSSTMKTFVQQQQDYFNTLQDRSFALSTGREEIKLPKISIPQFYGNYADFPSFKDLYEATIHNNDALSKVHKFKYLKGLLGGEAGNIVKHVTISDANYDSTWEKIVKRFDHKDHIMSNLIRQFLAQPRIRGSSKEIRRMVDTTEEVLRGLTALGDDAITRDGWLIYLLLERCDEETRKAWALKAIDKGFPTIDEFTSFLDNVSNALERAEPVQKIMKTSNTITNANVLAVATCLLCDQQHLLHKCDKFLALDVSSRRGLIAEKKLCFNCMRGGHRSDLCKLKLRCFKCNRKHNILLHTDNIGKQNQTASNPQVANVKNEAANLQLSTNGEPILDNNLVNLNIQAILPTAIVRVQDGLGQMRTIRVLLDSGSQASFIDESYLISYV